MKKRIIALILCIALGVSIMSTLASCKPAKAEKPDALIIMTEDLDGLFNPFFSTTAADGTIVSMTQIGMLTTGYKNGKVTVAFGDNEAVATKDYASRYDAMLDRTTYTFVIKNGIKFSDGEALTIEDVLFNMYVYLDPVYTGSSTMYSTDIVGLADYRTQTWGADSDVDDTITENAQIYANNRINELINLFKATGKTGTQGTYNAPYASMVEAIKKHGLSSGYKAAISTNPNEVTYENLLADYELALKYFKEELENDYVSAQEAYKEAPYKGHTEFDDEIFCFMTYEGLVTIEYAEGADGKKDKTKIESFDINYNTDIATKEAAIDYVFNRKIAAELDMIVQYWATAQKLQTEYLAKAKEVILQMKAGGDGELSVPNIEGIVSLGHSYKEGDATTVTVNGNTYNIATEHNPDGTPKNPDTYDVLEITINGVDPKAVWNFAFAVAPQHYYAPGYTVDIANDKFGVDYGSFDFMSNVIQSYRNVKLPMGAGAYKVSDASNSDTPSETAFFSNKMVYFKRNNNFETVGAGISNAKIEKVRYQEVQASNALVALETGTVHYATPQLTDYNINRINAMKDDGIDSVYTDQLGYGYIGINAGKVENVNLRRAIMSAMNTSLAVEYYRTGTASAIYWPMSTVSWAYPKNGNVPDRDNGHSYPAVNFTDSQAKADIENYMQAAGVAAGDPSLSIKFTIAGASLSDHPTYKTFIHAAELLNECGWDIEVIADTQALKKISTGSLAVWAAAWGSTVDPDLYQVYHKNSTATSTLAWGYRDILANPDLYSYENEILDLLSRKIDEARTIDNETARAGLYKEAMGYILDLAIELPVYQRSVLYAYNSNVIATDSLPTEINPYSSPLDRIWEIEFAE